MADSNPEPRNPWRDPVTVSFEEHLRTVRALWVETNGNGPEREQSLYRPINQTLSYTTLVHSVDLTSADKKNPIPIFLSVCPQGPVYAHHPSVSASTIPVPNDTDSRAYSFLSHIVLSNPCDDVCVIHSSCTPRQDTSPQTEIKAGEYRP